MVKTHKFGTQVYNIIIEKLDGYCDVPSESDNLNLTIPHDPSNTKKFLETVVHESLHASFPHMAEERVDRAGKDIARLLWRLGYRLKGKE